jgi:hypothetical protein
MNDTELDARLRRAAEQWRSDHTGLAGPVGPAEISLQAVPHRPASRRRWPTVLAASVAAVLVLGTVGLLIDKATSRTSQRAVSPAASQHADLSPLPPNGTTIPSGTGQFVGPDIQPPDHALAAPRIAHGPGRTLVISLEGSGTCPTIATSVRLTGPQQLAVDSTQLPAHSGRLCTMDLSPHLTTLPLPAGADEHQALQVTVERYTIDLPPQ